MRLFKRRSKKGNSKSGRFSWLRRFKPRMPKYFRESFAELKKVTWPGRKEAWKLTLAVFVFSFVFTVIVVVADFGIEIIAKELFL